MKEMEKELEQEMETYSEKDIETEKEKTFYTCLRVTVVHVENHVFMLRYRPLKFSSFSDSTQALI